MKRSPRSPGPRRRPRSTEPAAELPAEAQELRLARFLAMAGVDARRDCETLVASGRVSVNRETITDPAFKVDPTRSDVRLDGEKLSVAKRAYFLLNKPRGYLCTSADPQGRKRVIELFPEHHGRLFSVGRLDENSQGLLVVTNDGDLAERLAHPRYAVPKVYHVLVAGIPEPRFADKLVRGMRFDEGIFRVKGARLLKSKGQSSLLEITLTEGQNREIRRLLARLGHKVMRLERVALGPLKLGALPIGAYRPLTRDEVLQLVALLKVPARPRENPRKQDRSTRAANERVPEASVVGRRVSRLESEAAEAERPRRRPATGSAGERSSGDRRPTQGRTGEHRRTGENRRSGEQGRAGERRRESRREATATAVELPRTVIETDEGDTITAPGAHPAIARPAGPRGANGGLPERQPRTEGKRPAFKPRGKGKGSTGKGSTGKPRRTGGRMAAKRPGGKRKEY